MSSARSAFYQSWCGLCKHMLFNELRLAPEPKLSYGLIVVLWAGRPPLHVDDGAGHVKASGPLRVQGPCM